MLQQTFVSLNRQGNEYTLDIFDLGKSGTDKYLVKRFRYTSEVEATQGELSIIGNSVYLAPHNKVLYLYDGQWYLRDFVSTTPVVISPRDNAEFGEGAVGYITFDADDNLVFEGILDLLIDGREVIVDFLGVEVSFDVLVAQTLTELQNSILADEYVFDSIGDILGVPGGVVTITIRRRFPGNYTAPVLVREVPIARVYEFALEGINGQVVDAAALNQNYSVFFSQSLFSVEPSDITGGIDAVAQFPTGRLDQQQEYFYTARYIYRDGHVTQTAFPVFTKTTNDRRYVVLDIDLVEDIDGTFADVEIYRRRGSGDFQRLERLRSPQANLTATKLRYIDDGKLTSTSLEERISVWTERHETQLVVRDRYVRANLTYPDRTVALDSTIIPTTTPPGLNEESIPNDSLVDVYARVRFNDGQLSFHQLLASGLRDATGFRINDPNDFKETAYYLKYANVEKAPVLTLRSNEIYNINVPSIATTNEPEAEQDRPVNPHVFLAYRYVQYSTKSTASVAWTVRDDVHSLPGSGGAITLRQLAGAEDFDGERIYVQGGRINPIFSFVPRDGFYPYVKRRIQNTSGSNDTIILEFEYYDALKEAIQNGHLAVRSEVNEPQTITGRTTDFQRTVPTYSSQRTNEEYFGIDVPVVGFEDTSLGQAFTASQNELFAPETSRMYLVLDPESPYGDFEFKDQALGNRFTFPFSLLNVEPIVYSDDVTESNEYIPSVTGANDLPSRYFVYDTGLKRVNNANPDLPLIYAGKLTDGRLQPRSGYILRRRNGYQFYEIAEYNIYEQLIQEEDLGYLQFDYPNQLAWSDSFIEGTNVSGVRNFRPESFLNISTEHGPIIKIEYVGNNILVFCRNGLAVVTVGEVLTQGTENQIRVDTSRFLNSEVWVLKTTTDISKASIKRYENMVFFADAQDVWMYTDGPRNVSNGAVPVFGGVGAIHPTNKEYWITSNGVTWAYNFEIQQWTGPYTYEIKQSAFSNNRLLSVIGGRINDHTGNTFNGEKFDTIIESVAEDLGDASTDKLYRKFYAQTDGDAKFEYTKDQDYFGRNLSEYPKTGDTSQIGIKNIGAAKRLYWRFTTQAKDFILKLIAFEYTPRNRR